MININELAEELNSQQKEAVKRPINTFTKIVAGAGTGKTKTITKRFVKLVNDLIMQGVENPLEHILVITFTDKAAGEMKNRILCELRKNNINYFGQENFISTIHSFCTKILKKYSIEANISPNFKVGDDVELSGIYDNIIKKIKYGECSTIDNIEDVAKELGIDDINTYLSKEQLVKLCRIGNINAVFDDILPIIKQIKSMGCTPKHFLNKAKAGCIDFSRLIEQLKIIPGFEKDDYCKNWGKILKQYTPEKQAYISLEAFDSILKEKTIIDKNGRGSNVTWEYALGYPETISEITEIELYLVNIIAIIYALFEKHLEARDLVDFDDIINKTLYIIENNVSIREYYKNFFKHIIVDEFQDTNTAQLRLLMNLLHDDAPNITIVGDRKQSIYAFRHARVENLDIIQDLIQDKYNNKYESISLSTNYRSTKEILDVTNSLTVNNIGYNGETLTPNKKDPGPSNSVKISVLSGFENAKEHKIEEAKYIASEIIKYKKRDGLQYRDFAILVNSHNISETIEDILATYGIPAIKKANMNYFKKPVIKNVLSMLMFLQNSKNEVALARILKIYFSDKELFEFKKELDKLLSDDKEYEYINMCDKIFMCIEKNIFYSSNIDKNILSFIQKLLDITSYITDNKKSMTLRTIYNKLITEIKPYKDLSEAKSNMAELDLEIFEKIIVDYMKTEKYMSLKCFLEYVEKIKGDKSFELPDIFDGKLDAVQILTIHASKGLEFPYVFVTSVSNKQQPDCSCINLEISDTHNFGLMVSKYNGNTTPQITIYKNIYRKIKNKAEELRRYYVTLSRAENYLNVLSFEKYSNSNIAEYIQSLQENLSNIVENIDTNNLALERKPIIKYKAKKDVTPCIKATINTEKAEKQLPMSFSKISTFNNCKQEYTYKYIYHYPELSDKSPSLAIGSLVHNLIYNTFINDKTFTDEQIDEYLKDSVDIDIELVKRHYNSFKKSEYSRLKSKDVLPEYGFEFSYRDVLFRGDIDLIWKNEKGGIDIIDFKTNKDIGSALEKYFKQIYIYKKAMEQENYRVDNLFILNIKEDGVDEYKISLKDIENAGEELDADIDSIVSFTPQNIQYKTTHKCQYCGYKYICLENKEFFKSILHKEQVS